jgi:hypothetical protein
MAAAAAGLALAASAAHATVFTLDSFNVDAHTNPTQNGLTVAINPLLVPGPNSATNLPLTFDLGASNPQTFDLFEIYTPESSVNFGEDTTPYDISATFNFSGPAAGSATVGGDTFGVTFFGVVQYGEVTWNGPANFTWGNGGLMTISLSNETFNQGFFGLNDGNRRCGASCYGADVDATFDWQADPTGVPEPASWALMIGGFGLAGAALRRSRATPVAA